MFRSRSCVTWVHTIQRQDTTVMFRSAFTTTGTNLVNTHQLHIPNVEFQNVEFSKCEVLIFWNARNLLLNFLRHLAKVALFSIFRFWEMGGPNFHFCEFPFLAKKRFCKFSTEFPFLRISIFTRMYCIYPTPRALRNVVSAAAYDAIAIRKLMKLLVCLLSKRRKPSRIGREQSTFFKKKRGRGYSRGGG